MVSVVISIVVFVFGLFLYYGQMLQLMKWLFFFGWGLCYVYWVFNVWVLYSIGDKFVIVVMWKLFGVYIDRFKVGLIGGFVGDFILYVVFFQIILIVLVIFVIGLMMLCFVQVWCKLVLNVFICWVVYMFICGFMFGWYVYEKVFLYMVILFSVLVVECLEDVRVFFFLLVVLIYLLFFFFFELKEYFIKVIFFFLYVFVIWFNFL